MFPNATFGKKLHVSGIRGRPKPRSGAVWSCASKRAATLVLCPVSLCVRMRQSSAAVELFLRASVAKRPWRGALVERADVLDSGRCACGVLETRAVWQAARLGDCGAIPANRWGRRRLSGQAAPASCGCRAWRKCASNACGWCFQTPPGLRQCARRCCRVR